MERSLDKNISVITVHGMGKTDRGYYKELKSKLRKYVGKSYGRMKFILKMFFIKICFKVIKRMTGMISMISIR